jgi:Na+/proline symporter
MKELRKRILIIGTIVIILFALAALLYALPAASSVLEQATIMPTLLVPPGSVP